MEETPQVNVIEPPQRPLLVPRTNAFILKTLAAEEIPLHISPEMRTLRNLRQYVANRFHIPPFMQKFKCYGTYWWDDDDETLLEDHILCDHPFGPNQDRIIWLVWMTDDDYYDPENLYFLASSYEMKRQESERAGRRFEPVTLRTYRVLSTRAATKFHHWAKED